MQIACQKEKIAEKLQSLGLYQCFLRVKKFQKKEKNKTNKSVVAKVRILCRKSEIMSQNSDTDLR